MLFGIDRHSSDDMLLIDTSIDHCNYGIMMIDMMVEVLLLWLFIDDLWWKEPITDIDDHCPIIVIPVSIMTIDIIIVVDDHEVYDIDTCIDILQAD